MRDELAAAASPGALTCCGGGASVSRKSRSAEWSRYVGRGNAVGCTAAGAGTGGAVVRDTPEATAAAALACLAALDRRARPMDPWTGLVGAGTHAGSPERDGEVVARMMRGSKAGGPAAEGDLPNIPPDMVRTGEMEMLVRPG